MPPTTRAPGAEHVYCVGVGGVLVHNQYHHIVSIYKNLSRPEAAEAIDSSKAILKNAGIGLWTKSAGGNLRWIASHRGQQHTIQYHVTVNQTLRSFTNGLSPKTLEYTDAVRSGLDKLTEMITSGALPLF